MKRILLFSALITLLALVAAPALAKGPADKITISGPGLRGVVEITDQATLEALPIFAPADIEFDNRRGIAAPEVGEGYELVRYFQQGNTLRAIDMAHYYPNPSGGVGYVFYDGLVDPGMYSEFDGKWYPATPKGDAVMKQLLAQHGVSLLPSTGVRSRSLVDLLVLVGGLLAGGLWSRKFSLHGC
jgi:hypothetical protein